MALHWPVRATSLRRLAKAVSSAGGRPETAVTLAAAADQLLHEEGVVVAYSADSPGRPHLDAAESALTSEQISQAKEDGRSLSAGEALALARS